MVSTEVGKPVTSSKKPPGAALRRLGLMCELADISWIKAMTGLQHVAVPVTLVGETLAQVQGPGATCRHLLSL